MKFATVFLLTAAAWAQPVLPVLRYVTTLAGSDRDSVSAAAVDPSGNLWVTGTTSSLDFPVTSNAFQPHAAGSTLLRIDGGKYSWSMSPVVTAPQSIAASLLQPGLLFASDSTGLHKSTDGGDTWTSLNAFPSAHPPTAMAADPGNAAVLYAGNSDGLFKTSDGGLTWTTLIPAPSQNSPPLLFQIIVDPLDSRTVIAVSYGGNVYRSPDSGATWTQVFMSGSRVSFDPSRPGVAFLFDPQGNLYKSTDHAATWTQRGVRQFQAYLGAAPFPDPFHPGTLYLGAFSAIYRSTDDGTTWTVVRSASYLTLFAADPSSQSLSVSLGTQWVSSTDGFATVQTIGPPTTPQITALAVGAGPIQGGPPRFYIATAASSDAFIAKLDPTGSVLYSTYLGGSAADTAVALALDPAGNVYVTGLTGSADFPITKGAYLAQIPDASSAPPGAPSSSASFVIKLSPNGALLYSTYFTAAMTFPRAIAVSSSGEAYLTGFTQGGLPVTPGALQGGLSPACGFIPCTVPPLSVAPIIQQGVSNVFFTHFSADGSTLLGSTYLGDSSREGDAIAVDSQGIAYIAGGPYISELSLDAKSLLRSTAIGHASLVALALDAKNNIYVAGAATTGAYTSPGAFQPASFGVPTAPGDRSFNPPGDAYAAKLTPALDIQYATFLGGESVDAATAIAVDQSGIATVVGNTASKSFPIQGAFQASFSPSTGFITRLNADATGLVYSTYVGDTRLFQPQTVALDASGNAIFAGSTLHPDSNFPNFRTADDVFVARVDAVTGSPVIMGSVTNAASNQGGPIAPGETITITGQGFGADAQLMLDSTSLKPIASAPGEIIVTVPASYQQRAGSTASLQVQSGGAASNVMIVPVAAAAPGIFSADASGAGQGYILNSDLTLNSPSNPTAEKSLVSIALTGVGITSRAGQSDLPALPVAVFIDGFYCTGYDARVLKIPGLPGDVFLITVYVPHPADNVAYNPNLLNYKMPPTVAVNVQIGSVLTQAGISLSVQ